ncbi:hypothetical protein Bca52824_003913 [Brassica carinata]|uniref:RNase H type-1 domain-containing protein n=1 Tax=Brassica carinata TaxID=52824 RepID=A0A8X7WKW3_BRACI|nr:hypothetical protein Bca52824_003913 [Brassica carinata]
MQIRPDTTYCKVDASWDKASNSAGFAWIFNGPHCRNRTRITSPTIRNPLMEALAIRFSLRMAASLEIQHLRVCSDVRRSFELSITELWFRDLRVVADINHLSSLFVSISFAFIPRSQNSEADALAKHALSSFSFVRAL